jgi:mycofactocin system glycosyltransferase
MGLSVAARFRLDPSTRRFGGSGEVLLGGSPTRMLRLSAAGARLVDRLTADRPDTDRSATAPAPAGAPVRRSAGESELIDRLVDAGVLHPVAPVAAPADPGGEVTVVVPVRDDPDGVARLLDSLRAVDGVGEVIVVDDGSSDPARLAAVVDASVVRGDRGVDAVSPQLLRLEASLGPGAARNAGAARARSDLVAFVDADCVVTRGWLAPLRWHLRAGDVAIVAPRVAAAPAREPGLGAALIGRYERFRSPLDLGAVPGPVGPGRRIGYLPSAAMLVRADDLGRLGGFDESLRVGEDVDLVWRATEADLRVRYEPAAVVRHEARRDLAGWLRQRVSYGSSAAGLDERHPGAAAPARLSFDTAAVWLSCLAGAPLLGALVVVWSSIRLRRRLPAVPTTEAVRLGVQAHLSAGRQLARCSVRAWWPVTLVAASRSRRARWLAAAGIAVSVLDARRDAQRTGLPDDTARPDDTAQPVGAAGRIHAAARFDAPARFDAVASGVLAVVDDVAYGAGLWRGCWRARSLRALLPAISRPI